MLDLNKFKSLLNNYSSDKKESNKLVFSVYAICKNEVKNVDEWLKQFDKCDYICVLDTGSKDGTYERLQEFAKTDKRLIVSQKKYENFHYDEARNDSYDLIPYCTDVCVTIDFDERLQPDWFEYLNKKYINCLKDNVIHIKRKIFKNGVYDNRTDTRLTFHPYLKDNKVFKWCGYSGENIVYGYDKPMSLEEVSKGFRIYRTITVDDIYCDHYVLDYGFNFVLKSMDGNKKCVEYFHDIHYLFLKENNFFKLISYCHTRMIDYHSFIRIFKAHKELSNDFLAQDLSHLIDVVKSQRIDISHVNNNALSFIVDGILKQRGIFFGPCPYVDELSKLLVDYASNKERVRVCIEQIQKELDDKFTKETDKWKWEKGV